MNMENVIITQCHYLTLLTIKQYQIMTSYRSPFELLAVECLMDETASENVNVIQVEMTKCMYSKVFKH